MPVGVSFVGDFPLKYTDPTGHEPCEVYNGSECAVRYYNPDTDTDGRYAFWLYDSDVIPEGGLTGSLRQGLHASRMMQKRHGDELFVVGAFAISLCLGNPACVKASSDFVSGLSADLVVQFALRMVASSGDWEWSRNTLDLQAASLAGSANLVTGGLMSRLLYESKAERLLNAMFAGIVGTSVAGLASFTVFGDVPSNEAGLRDSALSPISPYLTPKSARNLGDVQYNMFSRVLAAAFSDEINSLSVDYQRYQGARGTK
jgi:hypothetical protein